MGVWIAVVIGLFALGSFMGLKPSGLEQRLDKLRMTARRLELNPKLIAYPKWLTPEVTKSEYLKTSQNTHADPAMATNDPTRQKMIAQYALILPKKRLPEQCYTVENEQLCALDIKTQSRASPLSNSASFTNTSFTNISFPNNGHDQQKPHSIHHFNNLTTNKALNPLDNTPLQLPQSIAPFVKAVYIKANSVVIFWDDVAYVIPAKNPNFDPTNIEPDLLLLKERLKLWAEKLESIQ